jgi:hypothetical protein
LKTPWTESFEKEEMGLSSVIAFSDLLDLSVEIVHPPIRMIRAKKKVELKRVDFIRLGFVISKYI